MNTRRIEILLALLLVVVATLSAGCSNPAFVVSRDVPLNPSFCVVPATREVFQIEYANRFEGYLIAAGIRVIDPQPARKVTTLKEGVEINQNEDLETGSHGMMIERYGPITDIPADYILTTDAEIDRLRIIRITDREILASFKIKNLKKSDDEKQFREAITALGLTIRK